MTVREAGAALRAASEAVAKARDAVVEAARSLDAWMQERPESPLAGAQVAMVRISVTMLLAAERAEAEARARLEALR